MLHFVYNGQIPICPAVPVQIILPYELDSIAVSNLLLYFHGHDLVCGGKEELVKLYVATRYFGCGPELVDKVRERLIAVSDGTTVLKCDKLASVILRPGFYSQHVPVNHVSQLPRM